MGGGGGGPARNHLHGAHRRRLQDGREMVSLRNDLLPLFGLSCVVSDCHSPRDHKAGITLGNKCAYDMNAKWKCTFPTAPDPMGDPTKPAPDDEALVAMIYKDLTDPAMTVNGGAAKRVVPGDPANSFFLLKLADQENSKGYACTNQDPSHESSPPPCGVAMPRTRPLLTARPARFNAVAYWIAQGAKNNARSIGQRGPCPSLPPARFETRGFEAPGFRTPRLIAKAFRSKGARALIGRLTGKVVAEADGSLVVDAAASDTKCVRRSARSGARPPAPTAG